MRLALRITGVLLGIGLWIAGFALVMGDGHVVGAILVLLGALAVVLAVVSDRFEAGVRRRGAIARQLGLVHQHR
jgi:uncharacterized membrane protein